jgi:hypothetical protein
VNARHLLLLLPLSLAAATPEQPVDKVSQNAIQSALRVLRRDYIRREDLTFDQLNRAALQGLLTRLDFGAEIIRDDSKATKPDGKVIAETITGDTSYLRPTSLIETEVPMLEARLRELSDKGTKHFVLDLRSPTTPGDFETAAAVLELFLPRGTLLFKLKQLNQSDAQLMLSRREPVWRGSLVVLIDNESSNIAETIAAVLKAQHRAILVGTATRGATVRYDTVPLDAGWKLRFARAEMLLPDESSVFRKGVVPDFAVKLDGKTKRNIFALSAAGSIKPFILEQARPRFNEAALVANRNPELDDYIRRSSGETLSYDQPPARDTVLQRALDLITAGTLLDPFADPLK